MSTSEPGERRTGQAGGAAPGAERRGRLERPPSARYAQGPESGPEDEPSLAGALPRAVLAAAVGATVLFVVGAVLASTAGLLFVAGVTGAAVGLALARAAVAPDRQGRPLGRTRATWLAIGIALLAVVVADVATWLFALQEGGALGLVDYLLTTFGPFVPGELLFAGLGAVWGAGAGPVRRS